MRHLTLSLVAAVAALGLAAPSASAAKSVKPNCSGKLVKSANKHRAVVVKKEGTRAPGRDIVKYGIKDDKRASCAQLRKYRNTLVRLHTPAPAPQPVAARASTSAPVSASTSGGSSNSMVDPSCESGGNSQVVDPSGTYWGKYQFDAGTWAAHGGDPSQYGSAPESVQDQIAANVQYDAWPNC